MLLNQGFQMMKLKTSIRQMHKWYHELVLSLGLQTWRVSSEKSMSRILVQTRRITFNLHQDSCCSVFGFLLGVLYTNNCPLEYFSFCWHGIVRQCKTSESDCPFVLVFFILHWTVTIVRFYWVLSKGYKLHGDVFNHADNRLLICLSWVWTMLLDIYL